jgi:lipopolysaccharide transport system ATP-binding protein
VSDPAVRLESVSKRYPRGGARYASLRADLAAAVKRMSSRLGGKWTEYRGPLALDDVSFAVAKGESFALVGPNGAGKTTALKLITRISFPTSGRIEVRGRIGALIEVGSGVHPELTGRENIWLYGRILGMSKSEVRRRFDEIVDFAEIESALERPVKMYSSGMQLRLGFAIASHLDPDIFVVDEALAVGDAGFQAKCVERMTMLTRENRTLMFVSHNLSMVESVCERGIFLLGGRVEYEGPISDVIRKYLAWVDEHRAGQAGAIREFKSASHINVTAVTCHDRDGHERYAFNNGDDIEVRVHLDVDVPIPRPMVHLGITEGRRVISLASMKMDGQVIPELAGGCVVSCLMKSVPLMPGVYEFMGSVTVEQGWGNLVDWQPLATFRIDEPPAGIFPNADGAVSLISRAPVYVPYEWSWQTNGERVKEREGGSSLGSH